MDYVAARAGSAANIPAQAWPQLISRAIAQRGSPGRLKRLSMIVGVGLAESLGLLFVIIQS